MEKEQKKEAPKRQTPKKQTPKKQTPKKEKVEQVEKVETSEDEPKKQTPKKEEPEKEVEPEPTEQKKQTPKKQTPKKQTPKKQTPKKEEPKAIEKEGQEENALKEQNQKKNTEKGKVGKKQVDVEEIEEIEAAGNGIPHFPFSICTTIITFIFFLSLSLSLDVSHSLVFALNTVTKFSEIPFGKKTVEYLKENNLTELNEDQKVVLPDVFIGEDTFAVMDAASEVLAYLVPCAEMLEREHFAPRNGAGALVLVPTREVAIHVMEVAKGLMEGRTQTQGMVIEGTNVKPEAEKLSNGLNLLIAMPKRFLRHVAETPKFKYRNVRQVVLVHADQLLAEYGAEVEKIMSLVQRDGVQKCVFATKKTAAVSSFVKRHLDAEDTEDDSADGMEEEQDGKGARDGEMEVEAAEGDGGAAMKRANVDVGYTEVELSKRFPLLHAFIKTYYDKKVAVVFSSGMSSKFFSMLLFLMKIDCFCLDDDRTALARFNAAAQGVFLFSEIALKKNQQIDVSRLISFLSLLCLHRTHRSLSPIVCLLFCSLASPFLFRTGGLAALL